MNNSSYRDELERIATALQAAVDAISPFVPGNVKADFKRGDDPVTEADRAADRVLREILLRDGEGWLSEESADDLARLQKERVWVVDPLDGTREFVVGIPEWCISIGLVENGKAVAGAICNPATGETFLGSISTGVTLNGKKAAPSQRKSLAGATVLASRSEIKRGEWERFREAQLNIRPVGSVAYKLALVSAGLADATWTLCPKNEWDIAAGVALVEAAGGFVQEFGGAALSFNNKSPLKPGLLASSSSLKEEMLMLTEGRLPAHAGDNGCNGGRG
jgi:myo-inositol-1(or 4)-monophosphatase